MLAAYRGKKLDRLPVAPEFWCYMAARTLGVNQIELHREIPLWKALQETFKHYECEGWAVVGPAAPPCPFRIETEEKKDDKRIEIVHTVHAENRNLTSRQLMTADDPPWRVERPIKDFEADWEIYKKIALPDPAEYNWEPVCDALREVGEDYLLEVFIANPFTDFVGEPREGDFTQMILDLTDHEHYLTELRQRYIEHRCQLIRDALAKTPAESVFIGCSWACASLLGAPLWRKWDKPALQTFVKTAHDSGGLIHIHCHGSCTELVPDFAEMEVDCLCPLERPPGGDVTPENMPEIKDITRGNMTLNGNVHTVETLIRAEPQDVREEVEETLNLWGDDGRLIVGTGDQVGGETPDENIHAMIETVKTYGE
ncbi:MAG: uroporphyrinogen decarboxylase family protein [Candidatus Brocadiia bacterium]